MWKWPKGAAEKEREWLATYIIPIYNIACNCEKSKETSTSIQKIGAKYLESSVTSMKYAKKNLVGLVKFRSDKLARKLGK